MAATIPSSLAQAEQGPRLRGDGEFGSRGKADDVSAVALRALDARLASTSPAPVATNPPAEGNKGNQLPTKPSESTEAPAS